MEHKENKFADSKMLLPASILIAALLISGSVIYSRKIDPAGVQSAVNSDSGAKSAELSIRNADPVIGNDNTQMTIVEFGDFQCPYCAKFSQEIEKNMKRDFVETGKAKFVYKALAFLDRAPGSESADSVKAAYCAKEQNKFWEMHDAIFFEEYNELQKYMAGKIASPEGNGNLNIGFFKLIAEQNGMNVGQFNDCFNSDKYNNIADENMNEAKALMQGSVSTPTIFVNGKRIEISEDRATGKFDYNAFKVQLDSIK